MPHLSLDPVTIGSSDIPTLCRVARAAGYEAISLRYPHLEAYLSEGHSVPDVRQLLDDHGLVFSDAGFLAEWQFWDGLPLISHRSRSEARTDESYLRERLHRFFSHCQELAVRYVRAAASPDRSGELEAAGRDFARVCSLAAPYGLNVGFEFFGNAICISRLTEAARLVREVAAPNSGLILDTFLFHQGGSCVEEMEDLSSLGVSLHSVHVADAAAGEPGGLDVLRGRRLPGTGSAALASILGAIRRSGYDGWYVVEVFNPPMDYSEALRTAETARLATLELLSGTS